jgi:hypothetical protein
MSHMTRVLVICRLNSDQSEFNNIFIDSPERKAKSASVGGISLYTKALSLHWSSIYPCNDDY